MEYRVKHYKGAISGWFLVNKSSGGIAVCGNHEQGIIRTSRLVKIDFWRF